MGILSLWQYIIIPQVCIQKFTFGIDGKCQSFKFYLPLTGKYCPGDGAQPQRLLPHDCKLMCIQSSNCAAFNYNHTTGECTPFAAPCIQAMPEATMEFGVIMPHAEVEQCYQWRPIAQHDWNRAVDVTKENVYVIRMLKGGSYYAGNYAKIVDECYAYDGTGSIINKHGYPCESLWINEGCTVYFQPYNLGEPLPERAVIAGSLANGDVVYVASLECQQGLRRPGYYIATNNYAHAAFQKSNIFNILVVL